MNSRADLSRLHLLLVDDARTNLDVLVEFLKSDYRLSAAINGHAALELAERLRPDLILLDVMMPELDGFEVCRRLKANPVTSSIPVIFITALSDPRDKNTGFNCGAADFIVKPFDATELLRRVGIQARLILAEARMRRLRINEETLSQACRLRLRSGRLEYARIMGLGTDLHDGKTPGHSGRVGALAAFLAGAAGLGPSGRQRLELAAITYDIGKLGLKRELLAQDGSLTPEELSQIREHCRLGRNLLAYGRSPLLQAATLIAYTHHENWDGSGYPAGLSGEDIPLSGRIVRLCDAYTSMLQDRPHRPAFKAEETGRIIREGSGREFDPNLVRIFCETEREFHLVADSTYPSLRIKMT